MIEELSEDEAREQFETNVFGALWITQAAVPLLRESGGGHILQVSSIGGVTAFPNIGIYHASKWALEGFSQSLAQEVADFGIRVTLIEPAGFATDWGGSSARHAQKIAAYDDFRVKAAKERESRVAHPGDPDASADVVLRLVDAENPPLRLFFGTSPLGIVSKDYESRLASWQEYQPWAKDAQG